MNIFLSLQQKLDILHDTYLVPHAIESTACKYYVDPNQICRWKASLTGLEDEEGQHQLVLLTSFKGQAKKTLCSGKVHIGTAQYGAIWLMFDTLHNADQHVSVMMFTVELKRISCTPVSFLVLSKCVSCWLASMHFVHCCITNIAQNTCQCEVTMQDFVAYINSQLSKGQYSWQCVVYIDETNIFFDMDSGLILANKGDKTVSLTTAGTSTRCTVLLGDALNGEKLTPLILFKGQPICRIARTFNGMPASMRYVARRRLG